MKVTIKTVPVSGEPHVKEIEVPETGASVGEVLRTAGIGDQSMKVMIGDRVVDSDVHVAAGATVTLTERPRGS